MSAKFQHSLKDEKSDLQKQFGCMNGIFQLFDRHHKRLPSGQSARYGMEQIGATGEIPGQNREEVGNQKHTVPDESSRTSCSSSCSSTFSSVDCKKTAQPEPWSSGQSISPQTPSPIMPKKQPNCSLDLRRQSLDLRDVVKDSMCREVRGLSVKTVTKHGKAMKHVDSPRPLQQSTTVQPRLTGYEDSSRVLAKLREAPRNSVDKDGSVQRRFSYDGRESRDTSKSTIKLKELPRLSLDSREGSIRKSSYESRSSNLLKDIQTGNGNSSQLLNLNQEPGSNKRPSGVVAKLMGLEALPDSTSTDESKVLKVKPCQDDDSDAVSRSSGRGEESNQNQVSRCLRVPHKDPASPRSRNANSVMKPTSSSRFPLPLEPAPWRQADTGRNSQKPAFKYREAPSNTPIGSPSVYGEIEKQLTKLEFKASGKDLRALKQILEAMQKTREKLNKKEDESQTSKSSPNYRSFDQESMSASEQSQQGNYPVSPTVKGTSSPKRYRSPIVIIKPAKQIDKPRNSYSSVIKAEDLTPRNSRPQMDKKTNARTLRSSVSSMDPLQMSGEDSPNFGRSSRTVSPRPQQKKQSSHSSDSSRIRMQSGRQPIEASSPSREQKPKFLSSQQGNDQSSGFSSKSINLSRQVDTTSVQSESNISLDSQIDAEVTSTGCACQPKDPKDKNFIARLSEDGSMAALATVNLEQPSPVSVLDAMFYGEDSPSPVKKISTVFKDDETPYFDEADWNPIDSDCLLNSRRSNLSSETECTNFETIKHLVYELRLLNSTHGEITTDHIASLCGNTNTDHGYITEILLASGFLKNLGSSTTFQLEQSGHIIHPNFFHVLETTLGITELNNHWQNEKTGWSKSMEKVRSNEKIRRKLVFDTVNEILVRKLALTGSSESWISEKKQGGRSPSREKLLKELWSEMDHLQANPDCSLDDDGDGMISILRADMMHESGDWTKYGAEIPGLVLDIERLIFKDLISEVVSGGKAGRQDHPGRQGRL
ncbi:hypothetical protein RJ639_036794 [Escallonia herrerae]|uniref:DUF4378 domain-containing protein n=1 Tax=Escallonia herrerae TaxID=1293975 RepID=A0AA88X4Z1_9ASTE|nr:hypothetical protein RJ639_036794 [Escallonia herrerae]